MEGPIGSQPSQGPDTGPLSPAQQAARNAQASKILQFIADMGAKVFFEKRLTASDASGSGRVVVPKSIAEQYFPVLDQQNGLPVPAVDTNGRQYTFKFRYWVNNQSRMYLLEGAGELHQNYKMDVGDIMVFAQKPDGTLVVAGRPATQAEDAKKPPPKAPKGSKDPKLAKPTTSMPSADTKVKKKRAPPQTQYTLALLDIEAPADGIFRAVPNGLSNLAGGVAFNRGRWLATLNLSGELYQAVFETQEDANEAFHAAGGILPLPTLGPSGA